MSTTTHTGKIGRLSKDRRHQLALRIEDGHPGADIVQWLNQQPDVQKILQDQFFERVRPYIFDFGLTFGLGSSKPLGGMPRKIRVQYPGAMYHVMSRGDQRDEIFFDEARWTGMTS